MSGIFGLLERDDSSVQPSDFQRMAASLEACGPHRLTDLETGPIRMGHLLLDRGPAVREPCRVLYDRETDCCLAGDLRLDNQAEVAALLGVDQQLSRTLSDSSLVLKAYERWGADCAGHLLGDFAFALWDGKIRRLLLARDHFGIRPLFYASVGTSFYFASTLPGLLALPQVPRELNELIVARYLVYPCDSAGPTFYGSIQSLTPAHSLLVDTDGGTGLVSYWEPDPQARIQVDDDQECAEGFAEILREAVRSRIDTKSRVGVLVSGGLDSSTITAMAEKILENQPLAGFGYAAEPDAPAARFDERAHLEVLHRHIPGLDLRYVTAGGISPLDSVEPAFEALRAPVRGGLNYAHRRLLQEAQLAECGVLLSGGGGDEVASAKCSAYLPELLRSLSLRALRRELKAELARPGVSAARLWQRILLAQLPRSAWRGVHFLRRGYLGNFRTALRRDTARKLRVRHELNQNSSSWWDVTGYVPPSTRAELYLSALGLSQDGLDSASAVTEASGFGVSLRFPLADVRLVEYSLGVSRDQRRKHGLGRLLLRRASRDLLPERLRLRRDKCAFAPDYLLRVRSSLDRIRYGLAGFARDPTFRHFVDLEVVEKSVGRIASAPLDAQDVASDCLSIVLPAYYLGRFLELERLSSASSEERRRHAEVPQREFRLSS